MTKTKTTKTGAPAVGVHQCVAGFHRATCGACGARLAKLPPGQAEACANLFSASVAAKAVR